MDPDRHRRAKEIFHGAEELPLDQREAYLVEACAGDAELRREVERLLRVAAGTPDSFLEPPGQNDLEDSGTSSITVGQTLGHYRVRSRLGAGGMGEVWEAEDTKLKRRVALKILPPELAQSQERLRRFQREAETVAALDHPNIVTIYSVEEAEGMHFLTMELVEGVPLTELIPAGGMGLEDFLRFALPLAGAVSAAHEKGITHRDLKPANVMVTREGRVKVLDFGLAKPAPLSAPGESGLPTATMTAEGTILGTVAYMSPEQAEGKPVDPRSDVFSLGVVFYEMATGRRPFAGESSLEILSSVLHHQPASIADVRPELPHRMSHMVGRCLEKAAERRYGSASQVRGDLEALRDTVDSGSLSIGEPKARYASLRSLRGKTAVLAVLAVITLSGGIWLAFQRRGPVGRAVEQIEQAPRSSQRTMIVVLPFENLGGPEDEYFATGMTEEVTSRLAGLSGLGVISRNSANQYANVDKTTKQIGEELGVDYLLEGSVRWSHQPGGSRRVRITQQLVSVADDTHLWADSFDRELEDIFEVQTEIATRVVDRLGVTLLDHEQGRIAERPTENLEAYKAYLRALALRGASDWFVEESLEARLEHLERALELDPGFALAWGEIARVHGQFYSLAHDRSLERKELARRSMERAVELESDATRALTVRVHYLYFVERDFERVIEELAIVEKDLPDDPLNELVLASALRRKGRFEEAARIMADVSLLDPRNPRLLQGLGETYRYLREYQKALHYFDLCISIAPDQTVAYGDKAVLHWTWKGDTRSARKALEAAPEAAESGVLAHDWFWQLIYERQYTSALASLSASTHEWLGKPIYHRPNSLLGGYAYQLGGDHEQARTAFEAAAVQIEAELLKQPDNEKLHSALGVTYAAMGRKEEAIRQGIRATEITPMSEHPFFGLVHVEDLAWIYTLVGDHEAALDQIEILLSRPSHMSVPYLQLDPRWDALRDHPRFQELVKKYG